MLCALFIPGQGEAPARVEGLAAALYPAGMRLTGDPDSSSRLVITQAPFFETILEPRTAEE